MKSLPKHWTLAWACGLLTMGATWYTYTLIQTQYDFVQTQKFVAKNSVTWSSCADLIYKTSSCVQAGGEVSACINHAENEYKEGK